MVPRGLPPRSQLSYFSSQSIGKERAPRPLRDTARTGLQVPQDFNVAFSLLPCPSSRLELSLSGRVSAEANNTVQGAEILHDPV